MSNIQKIEAVVTSVDIGPAISLGKTPLLGGAGREAKYSLPTALLTATVLIQGNNAIEEPLEADAGWATLLTLTSASDLAGEIADLPRWIRWNTTVLDADGPNVELYLEGVQ